VPSIRLTEKEIAKLKAPHPSGKQVAYWDDHPRGSDLKGFGLIVSGKTTTKSYVVQREINGRTRRLTLGTVAEFDALGRTLEDVRREAAEQLRNMRKGIDPKRRTGATLRHRLNGHDALTTWLEEWLDKPLGAITPEMVEKKHREIQQTVAKRHNQLDHYSSQRGAATANGVMRGFRKLWNDAARDKLAGLPEDNPVLVLNHKKLWFGMPERERHINGDQLPAFYAAVKRLPSRTMQDYLLLLLFTGMRRKEAMSLRWADIDFSQRLSRIPSRRTKSQRSLDLPMSSYVFQLLEERRALGFQSEYVFAAESQTGHLAEPKKALHQVAKMCGVLVSPHDLRRTYITTASMCKIPGMALAGLVNHSLGPSITAGYARLSGADLAEAAEIVGQRILQLCNPKEDTIND
jgi:integrase